MDESYTLLKKGSNYKNRGGNKIVKEINVFGNTGFSIRNAAGFLRT